MKRSFFRDAPFLSIGMLHIGLHLDCSEQEFIPLSSSCSVCAALLIELYSVRKFDIKNSCSQIVIKISTL